MKTRLPILLLSSALIFVFCTGGVLFADNTIPDGCVTLHYPYALAQCGGSDCTFLDKTSGYIPYFRVFIPPGTIVFQMYILEYGGQSVIARHEIPPEGEPTSRPAGTPHNPYTLSDFEQEDQWAAQSYDGVLNIAYDSFPDPYLSFNRGGWLYVKVGGGSYSQYYSTTFTVTVDTATYNKWWVDNIVDADGWNQKVEAVQTYCPTAVPAEICTQDLPVLKVTPTDQLVLYEADKTTFTVSNSGTGTMPWTAAVLSGSEWLTIISESSGTNDGYITCGYSDNGGTTARVGTIRVTAAGATNSPVDVTVTQEPTPQAPVLYVTPNIQKVSEQANTTEFIVKNTGTGTMPWTAAVLSGSEWLTIISESSGTNDGYITCGYSDNGGTTARVGTIRVTAAGGATNSPVDVTVTQEPTPQAPVLDVMPNIQNVSKEAGTTEFIVKNTGTGTMRWTAAVLSGGDWLTITSGDSESNAGTIICSFSTNFTASKREGTILVKADVDVKSVSVQVIQETVSIVLSSLVPDTGLAACYDNANVIACPTSGQPFYGQDANFPLHPMSYTKLDAIGKPLSDAKVPWVMLADDVTGLIWEMKTNKDNKPDYTNPHDADNIYIWGNGSNAGALISDVHYADDFIKALNVATFGGYSDWRLPTIKELAYIVSYTISSPGPRIDALFSDTASSFYWSADAYAAMFSHDAWCMDFSSGKSYVRDKSDNSYSARAVRGGESGSQLNLANKLILGSGSLHSASTTAGIYTDNGDGTVTDISTGLMWGPNTSLFTTWQDALSYCETENYSGYPGWRLPTIKELQSLVDFSQHNPSVNPVYFSNMDSSFYWSSTTETSDMSRAWGVDFSNGSTGHKDKNDFGSAAVRAVRSVLLQTACTAILDDKLSLHVPIIESDDQTSEIKPYFWADFLYDPDYAPDFYFQLTNFDRLENPSVSCETSTLSGDLKLHIPDVLFSDGSHYWVDLEYVSIDAKNYFIVTGSDMLNR